MKAKLQLATLVCALSAGVAAAQISANLPGVQKRIHAMADMATDLRVLGDMAKGRSAFDTAVAQRAVDEITTEAARIPALFEAFEVEPGSDARNRIWSNYGDFTARANALQQVASGTTIRAPGDLTTALGQIGAACKSCHQTYRK